MNTQWKNILLPENSTIRDALEVINKESYRMALVVNQEDCLLGSVTDGDVRRALLNGKVLESSISSAMNFHPKTASVNTSTKAILEMMNTAQVIGIPIVSKGRIERVVTRADLQDFRRENIVVLMAGGLGKRLRPLTYDCPKPLLKIGDTPILEIILDRFIHAGFHNFFISTHYMSGRFQEYFGDGSKWNVNIKYLEEREPLGTGGAIGLLPKINQSLPMIVMNGDILTGVNFSELLSQHETSTASATMCISDHEYEIPFGVVNCDGRRVLNLHEKPRHKVKVNSGIYVLDPKVCKSVKKNVAIDMPEVLRWVLLQGWEVNTFSIDEYWLDIGRKEDFEVAQSEYQPNVVSINRK